MLRKALNFVYALLFLFCFSSGQAQAADENPPLIRGPGVSQETLEALAEAQGRTLLSDYFDLQRPSDDASQKITRWVERAQAAWLSGTIEAARSVFKDIAGLSLEADWREPQREAIQYAMLRLAQSAATATEKADWLERAITAFPDLHPDTDSFPPPLMEAFNSTRARILALATIFRPQEHFPDFRYLLINGKKFVLSHDLKIRLPKGRFRVTVLSDAYGSLSEIMTSSQLMVFRLALPPLAGGTCSDPTSAEIPKDIRGLTIVYSSDCLRTRTRQGWLARDASSVETKLAPFPRSLEDPFSANDPRPEISSRKKTWIWAGLSVLAIGAGYLAYREVNRDGEWEFGF